MTALYGRKKAPRERARSGQRGALRVGGKISARLFLKHDQRCIVPSNRRERDPSPLAASEAKAPRIGICAGPKCVPGWEERARSTSPENWGRLSLFQHDRG
jgi:hypothetical protein